MLFRSTSANRLLALGLTTSDLRWLAKRGFVSHAREITVPQDAERRFAPPEQNLAFAKDTCFVLTAAGLQALGAAWTVLGTAGLGTAGAKSVVYSGSLADAHIDLPSRAASGRQTQQQVGQQQAALGALQAALGALPNWDRDARRFLVGGCLIKHFRVPSPNQEAVLDAFQEEGWPASIDDPLPPVPDQQPKRRLRDTIKCLNLNQVAPLIRFHGDGTGQRVSWELVAQSNTASRESQPLRRAA